MIRDYAKITLGISSNDGASSTTFSSSYSATSSQRRFNSRFFGSSSATSSPVSGTSWSMRANIALSSFSVFITCLLYLVQYFVFYSFIHLSPQPKAGLWAQLGWFLYRFSTAFLTLSKYSSTLILSLLNVEGIAEPIMAGLKAMVSSGCQTTLILPWRIVNCFLPIVYLFLPCYWGQVRIPQKGHGKDARLSHSCHLQSLSALFRLFP